MYVRGVHIKDTEKKCSPSCGCAMSDTKKGHLRAVYKRELAKPMVHVGNCAFISPPGTYMLPGGYVPRTSKRSGSPLWRPATDPARPARFQVSASRNMGYLYDIRIRNKKPNRRSKMPIAEITPAPARASGCCSASSSFRHVDGPASTCTYFDCTKSHHSPPNHPRHGRVTFIIVGT
jgi:hypothetical protein